MTLDEAIVHEREVAKEKRKEMQCKTCKLFARSDLHPLQGYCRKNEFRSIEIDSWSKVCSEYVPKEMCKCAEEHEQLAEWLEELKSYRASVFSGDMTQKMLKEEYNKAIDNFVTKIKKYMETTEQATYIEEINNGNDNYSAMTIYDYVDELANELKAGEQNE